MTQTSASWYKRALWIVPLVAVAIPAYAVAQDDKAAEGSAPPAQSSDTGAAADAKAPDAGAAADASAAAKTDAGSADANAGGNAKAAGDAAKTTNDASKPAGDAAKSAGDAADKSGDRVGDAARDAGRDARDAGRDRGDRSRTRDRNLDRDRDANRDRDLDRNRDRDDAADDRDARDRTRDGDDQDDRADRDRRDDRRFSRDVDNNRRSRTSVRFGLGFSVGADHLVVTRLVPDTIAVRVGILVDDQIISINGHRIRTQADFDRYIFADTRERVTIIVIREGKEVTLYAEPAWFEEVVVDDDVDVRVRDDRGVYLGVEIDDNSRDAAVVVEVHPDSPADKVGVKVGDRIVRINGEQIDSADHFHDVVSNLEPGSDVELEFGRRETQSVEIHLDAPRGEVRGRRVDDVDVNVIEDRDPDVRIRGDVDRRDGDVEIQGEIRTDGVRTDNPPRRRGGLLPRLRGR